MKRGNVEIFIEGLYQKYVEIRVDESLDRGAGAYGSMMLTKKDLIDLRTLIDETLGIRFTVVDDDGSPLSSEEMEEMGISVIDETLGEKGRLVGSDYCCRHNIGTGIGEQRDFGCLDDCDCHKPQEPSNKTSNMEFKIVPEIHANRHLELKVVPNEPSKKPSERIREISSNPNQFPAPSSQKDIRAIIQYLDEEHSKRQ